MSEEHKIWRKAVKFARTERTKLEHELTDNRVAIRAALKESRIRRTVRVRSNLP